MRTDGAEVVVVMLGMNDTRSDINRTPEQYEEDMQILVDKLKNAGFRLVILNEPPAIDRNQSFASSLWDDQSNARLAGYIEKLGNIVLANSGFVGRGDTTLYQWFMDNPNCLGDGIHPNSGCGLDYIGEAWAGAIMSVFDYQINPNASFLSGNAHIL
jgi:lysophospholipase L1-like esterase